MHTHAVVLFLLMGCGGIERVDVPNEVDGGMDDGGRCDEGPTTSISYDVDGACNSASRTAACGGVVFEVDCACPDQVGQCGCLQEGRSVGSTAYDCMACAAVGSSWQGCGFP